MSQDKKEGEIHKLQAGDLVTGAPILDQPALNQRHNFAVQFLVGAARFAEESKQLEQSRSPNSLDRHREYIVAAIVMAHMSLEATINQYYLDAVDAVGSGAYHGIYEKAGPEVPQLMARVWPVLEKHKLPIIDKYQTALTLIGRQKLDSSREPYQSVWALIALRNALTHWKPEWESDQEVNKTLARKLRGKFPENPFATKSSTFFPTKCLSAGCAKWSVNSVYSFVDQFAKCLGAVFILEEHKNKFGYR
jgi:hypothetical protein